MARTAEWSIRKEAIFFVSNVFTGGSPKQVQIIVDMDGLEAMCDVLDINDATVVLTALAAIEKALRISKELGKSYDVYVDECDGVTKLEYLQQHTNDKIYNATVKIIEEFFGIEDDDCDENLAPATQDGFYTFGMSGTPTKNLFKAFDPQAFGSPPSTQSSAAKPNFGSPSFGSFGGGGPASGGLNNRP